MAKPMYNAREPANTEKVIELQNHYRRVYPKICGYEMKLDHARKKNEIPKTLKDKVISHLFFWSLAAFAGGLVYLFFWVLQNVTDAFTISMSILGILIGGPFSMIAAFIFYMVKQPREKEVYIKFPLKKEEADFRKMITELGEELEAGSKLTVFINNQPAFLESISFKSPLPKHVLFRGTNDDPSKRSFLFEIVDDEITVFLPDQYGVFKYDKKPKYDTSGIPDANTPRYLAEGTAIVGDAIF